MRLPSPCIICGRSTDGTRCNECTKNQPQAPRLKHLNKISNQEAGYNSRWRRLSARARRLQPFCSDCGATDNLSADHSPEAWRRHEQGLAIRLEDIDVVCMPCNLKRGPARGQDARSDSKPSNDQPLTDAHTHAGKPSDGHTEPRGDAPSGSRRAVMAPKDTDDYFPWKLSWDGEEV